MTQDVLDIIHTLVPTFFIVVQVYSVTFYFRKNP
jgi:hypothetical protein